MTYVNFIYFGKVIHTCTIVKSKPLFLWIESLFFLEKYTSLCKVIVLTERFYIQFFQSLRKTAKIIFNLNSTKGLNKLDFTTRVWIFFGVDKKKKKTSTGQSTVYVQHSLG